MEACCREQIDFESAGDDAVKAMKELTVFSNSSCSFITVWAKLLPAFASGPCDPDLANTALDGHGDFLSLPMPKCGGSARLTEVYDELRAEIKGMVHSAAKTRNEGLRNEFENSRLESQVFWKFEPTTGLLPFMSRLNAESPKLTELESADLLFAKYHDESDEKIRENLEPVALFKRDEAWVKKLLKNMAVCNDPKLSVVTALLSIEALRVAAAKFLLERTKKNEPPCCSFMRVDGDIETFMARPQLTDTLCSFSEALTAAQKAKDAVRAGGAAPPEGCDKLDTCVMDATHLYQDKGNAVLTGLQGTLTRLTEYLRGTLVPWKEFALECEDVARIKNELISNPMRKKVVPYVRALEAANPVARMVGTKCCDKNLLTLTGKAQEAIDMAMEQIATSAACVAIYVTAAGTALPSTKLKAIQDAKKSIGVLKISLHIVLQSRMKKTCDGLEEQIKREKEAKEAAQGQGKKPRISKA